MRSFTCPDTENVIIFVSAGPWKSNRLIYKDQKSNRIFFTSTPYNLTHNLLFLFLDSLHRFRPDDLEAVRAANLTSRRLKEYPCLV